MIVITVTVRVAALAQMSCDVPHDSENPSGRVRAHFSPSALNGNKRLRERSIFNLRIGGPT